MAVRRSRTALHKAGQPPLVAAMLTVLAVLFCGCQGQWNETRNPFLPEAETARWAVPVERPGLPNLYRVTENLYRGADPTAKGIRALRAMGVRTIVNLCSTDSDLLDIRKTPIGYEHIWFRLVHPETEDVVRFLRIATDHARTPVFVHCRRGADRTGLMCAAYRIVVCGWTKDQAIREMTEGGFGFDRNLKYMVDFVRNLDAGDLKRQIRSGP